MIKLGDLGQLLKVVRSERRLLPAEATALGFTATISEAQRGTVRGNRNMNGITCVKGWWYAW